MNIIAEANIPPRIRGFLRKYYSGLRLSDVVAHQVNQLHIKILLPWIRGTGEQDEAHFVLANNLNGAKPAWIFATGELWRAADRLIRS